MVTWSSLVARGVALIDGVVRVPDGALGDELEREMIAERDRRIPRFANGLPRPHPLARYGVCDVCLEPLEPHRGGMCPLCCAASRKALALRFAAPERKAA